MRLLLRSFADQDIPAIVRLAGTPEIAATTINIPHPYAEDDARSFLAHSREELRRGRSMNFAITNLLNTDLCGAIGLTIAPAHQRAELGYWIGVPFWRQGFATEAATAVLDFGFETLQLHRIHASHFAGNIASRRVLEKIGMRHEGRSREHLRKWGQFIDLENYALLKNEYFGGK
jgi:RimJ/RimL family protein N-acetyltransferase